MKRFFLTSLIVVGLALPASPAWAQRGGGGHGGGGHAGGGHAMGGASRGFGGPASRRGPSVRQAVPRAGSGPLRGSRPYRAYRGAGGYGYGAYGFYGPAFGYYDPFWDDWGYGYPGYGYDAPYMVPPDAVTGGLRVEVKPKTAQVYVDGYYAGIVDDFDGYFQHVDLRPGQHHIEVRAPGYAPLAFNTLIEPDHTTHFKGSLVPANSPVR